MSNHNDRNRNRQHGNRNQNRVFSKGEQHELIFAEKNFGGRTKLVSYFFEDTTVVIFPKSLRFRPIPGKKYQCSVKFRENDRGTIGLALPTLPHTLTPKEWIPIEELRSCLVTTITFEKRRGREGQDARLIAFHDGRAVFPDNGTTVVEGKPTACLLREAGNVAFAIPIGFEHASGTGLVRLGEKLGEVLEADLKHVVVRVASKKPGVIGMPKVEADLDVSGEYRNIYELLSDPEARVVVSESSSEDEVAKAYRCKAQLLHPDKVAQDFGGADKTPLPIKKNSEFFFEALGTAKDRALDLIARKKAKSDKREAPQAEASRTDGNASVQKADGQKRDRRPRKDRNAQRQQMPVVTAPVATEAPKAKEASVVTEEPKVEEPVLPQNEIPTIPAPAEAPKAEAAPQPEATSETEGTADEVDPMVKGLSEELKEPVAVIVRALAIAKKTPEEFAGLGENIHRFYLKQARGRVKAAKSSAAGAASGKKGEAKGGSQKGDFRAQLAGLKADK